MADNDGAAIDPRYDPAFQRGFDGEVATGAHGQSTLRRTAAVNPAPVRPTPQPVQEYGTTAQPVATAFAPRVDGTGAAAAAAPAFGVADASTVSTAAAPQVTPRELARNPFVIALIALAAALVFTGIVWAYQGFSAIVKNGGTRNEVEFWAAQTMSFGAPLVIVAGLAVIAVLLVLFGRSWQRSRD